MHLYKRVCPSVRRSPVFFRSRKSTNLTNLTNLTPANLSNLTEYYKSDKSDKSLSLILSYSLTPDASLFEQTCLLFRVSKNSLIRPSIPGFGCMGIDAYFFRFTFIISHKYFSNEIKRCYDVNFTGTVKYCSNGMKPKIMKFFSCSLDK